jgi:hypothetical protein
VELGCHTKVRTDCGCFENRVVGKIFGPKGSSDWRLKKKIELRLAVIVRDSF